ncbi:oxidoreductase [Solibacillus sp. R5-41]|uniref:oxidoreductase n=1 Tax=Solibacillus sp. R5-41 TaxID=2048654 RepID=UPI000C1282E1|nr:oxidoreductase [Solibacillus sp. R5-41]ATP38876.1 oxidoreductase [Solibacillus sp. R5-41]
MLGMRSALVVGATGLVGSALVKLLCDSEKYAAVNVISRRKLSFTHPKLNVKIREFDQIVDQDMEFAHEIFCCLGTTIKKAGSQSEFEKVDFEYPLSIAALAKNHGVPHFIVISAMGANEKSFAHYSRVKGKLENELIEMNFPRLSIVRPSLIIGDRQEFRLGELIGAKVLKIMNPLFVGPMAKYRSISANQIALAMKIIALNEGKQSVAIYTSEQLAAMQMPAEVETGDAPSKDGLFDWGKYKDKDCPPVDRDVVFDRSKIKEVDRKDDK